MQGVRIHTSNGHHRSITTWCGIRHLANIHIFNSSLKGKGNRIGSGIWDTCIEGEASEHLWSIWSGSLSLFGDLGSCTI